MVLYHAFILVAATVAGLLVLYVRTDWVLLPLALIFLLGVAWASKNTLPAFFEQIRVLLNLGSIREKERVVFNGLPWRVETLSIYTTLVNPELSGGRLRLPLRDITKLHSRPAHDHEVWFPCREGDWVVLSDGVRGKVISQAPEFVRLIKLGGARVCYETTSFLGLNPTNLSSNYRLPVVFGIDYQHQADCTTTIPKRMQELLSDGLTEIVGDGLINLRVEFKNAGASSLDFEVLADFAGSTADKFETLSRAIQRILVDACNQHGWVIPFTQVTLHQAKSA